MRDTLIPNLVIQVDTRNAQGTSHLKKKESTMHPIKKAL